MAEIFESIVLKVTADTDGLEKELDGADSSMTNLTKSTAASGAALVKWAAVGAGAAIAATSLLVKGQAEAVGEMDAFAKKLNINTQDLIELTAVAAQFGATAEDVGQGLKNVNERLADAALFKTGAAFDAIKILGLDLEKINKLDAHERFLEIADALSKVEDASTRTFLALELGEEEFFKLAEVINLGKDGIKDAMKEAQKFTGVLSDLDIENIRMMNIEATKTGVAFDSIFKTIAADVAPVMAELFSIASDLFVLFREEGLPVLENFGSKIFKTFLDFAESVLPTVITTGGAMFDMFKMGFVGLQSIVEAVFGFIGSAWLGLAGDVMGEGNWIDQMTVAISVVAQTWPEILKNAFLSIASIISSVASHISNDIMSTVDTAKIAGLKALAFTGAIDEGQLNKGLAQIQSEKQQRANEGNFFDTVTEKLEKAIEENSKVIQSAADEASAKQFENEQFVKGLFDRIRESMKVDRKEKEQKDNEDDINGGGTNGIKEELNKLITASEAGTKQSVDLLNSRALKGQDVNKGILGENKKQTTLLEKMLKDRGLNLPVAQGL